MVGCSFMNQAIVGSSPAAVTQNLKTRKNYYRLSNKSKSYNDFSTSKKKKKKKKKTGTLSPLSRQKSNMALKLVRSIYVESE